MKNYYHKPLSVAIAEGFLKSSIKMIKKSGRMNKLENVGICFFKFILLLRQNKLEFATAFQVTIGDK